MSAVLKSPVGDYDLRGRESKHRIYIGGFQPADGLLFLKVGMTSNMLDRIKAYAGMVPGGLSFMYSAKVESRGEAISAERDILLALSERDGQFCEMPLTLDYLCRKYEHMSVARYLHEHYEHAERRFSLARAAA